MKRVLKLGGVIGVRDSFVKLSTYEPSTPPLQDAMMLVSRLAEHNGLNVNLGSHLRSLLPAAGFARPEAFADVESHGSVDQTKANAANVARVWRSAAIVKLVLEQG